MDRQHSPTYEVPGVGICMTIHMYVCNITLCMLCILYYVSYLVIEEACVDHL